MVCRSPVLALISALLAATAAFAEDAPWDCTDADNLPQQGMNYCAYQDYKAADAELNEVYKKVRQYTKNQDKELAEWDKQYVGAEAALLKAQRGWIQYRDGQCESEGFYARGGSLEPLLVASCMADLTRRRTKELNALIEEH